MRWGDSLCWCCAWTPRRWEGCCGGSGMSWEVVSELGWHTGSSGAGTMLCGHSKPSFPAELVRLTFPVPTRAGVLLHRTLCGRGEQGEFHREKKTTGGKAAGKLCSRGAEAPIPSCRLQLCLSSLQLTSPMASCHGAAAAAAACSICVLPVTRLEYFWGCWSE